MQENNQVIKNKENAFSKTIDSLDNDFGMTDFFVGIYKWMSIGVLVSGLASFLMIKTSLFAFIFSNPVFVYGIIGIQILLMLGVQFMINKLEPSISLVLFLLYSFLTGITMSSIFYIYNIKTIIPTFAGAVALFIGLAFVGSRTKKNLLGMGQILGVSTFAIMIASFLNMLVFHSSVFDTVISIVVLVVFSALTIYDAQAYKFIYLSAKDNSKNLQRYTILGALHMYINLIAIFQSLLNLTGSDD